MCVFTVQNSSKIPPASRGPSFDIFSEIASKIKTSTISRFNSYFNRCGVLCL